MGYYVSTDYVNVTIASELLPDAFEAVIALNQREELKRGGTFTQDGKREGWFSWMEPDYDQKCKNLVDVFQMLGFQDSQISPESGQFELGYYDSKTGQEEVFLAAIAPFVNSGSEIQWQGSDGERWRTFFLGGRMYLQSSTIQWDEPGEEVTLATLEKDKRDMDALVKSMVRRPSEST